MDDGSKGPVLYTTRTPASLPITARLNESISSASNDSNTSTNGSLSAAVRKTLAPALSSSAALPDGVSPSDAVFTHGLILNPDAVSASASSVATVPAEAVERAHRERIRDTLRGFAAARRRGELRRDDGSAMTVREAAAALGVNVRGQKALRRLEETGEVPKEAIPALPTTREVSKSYGKLLVRTLHDVAAVVAEVGESAATGGQREWVDKASGRTVMLPPSDGETTAHLPPPLAAAVESAEKVFNSFVLTAPLEATHYAMMMTLYGRVDMPIKAAAAFDALRASDSAVPDTVAFNVMLGIMVRANKVAAACQLFEEMRSMAHVTGASPDAVTYTTVISALGKIADRAGALTVFSQMRKDGIAPTVPAWTAVIDAMCRANDFKAGLRLLHDMRESGSVPTAGTYRAVAVSSCRAGHVKLFLALAEQMRRDGHALDPVLLASVIRGFGEAGRSEEHTS